MPLEGEGWPCYLGGIKTKVDGTEASPMKAVVEELATLRAAFHETIEGYVARVEGEIAEIQKVIDAEMGNQKISGAKLRDLRDMLTLLRGTPIKPGKGRRKDLKKVDSTIEDLKMLIEGWK